MTADFTQPGDLDVVVLRHLRGFPDELHRFSNLVKLANPHGRTAVEFFLSRPAPADSFLAALCRAARDGDDVVTVVEAAEILGRPPAALLTSDAGSTLPAPIWGTGRHRLWRRAEMLGYAARTPRDGPAAPADPGPAQDR